jgi:peroxiredoxin Q/BCP
MTRGCTIESCGFRDVADKFAALDTVVIGISTDNLDDQQKFTDKEKLNFPLIADSSKEATKAYGALSPRGFANRYTFVIDKQGMIRRTYLQVDPAKHPEEVLKFVKENLAKN